MSCPVHTTPVGQRIVELIQDNLTKEDEERVRCLVTTLFLQEGWEADTFCADLFLSWLYSKTSFNREYDNGEDDCFYNYMVAYCV